MSNLHVVDYTGGVKIHRPNSLTGSQVSEALQTEPDEGYSLAVYSDSVSGFPDSSELYVAFSDDLPRSGFERFSGAKPTMVDGTVIEGSDEDLSTEEIWHEARRSGIRDLRTSRKVHKALRCPFIVR